jgi:hypothetical protein
MKIYGKPGRWFVEDEEGGEMRGPFITRAEIKKEVQDITAVSNALFRLIVERGENGRITEVKVVPNYTPNNENVEESEDVSVERY